MKECTLCKKIRPLDSFSPDKRTKTGFHSSCKKCNQKYTNTKLSSIDKFKRNEYHRKWKLKNIEKVRKYLKEWKKKNKEHCRLMNKLYLKVWYPKYGGKWPKENREAYNASQRRWRNKYPRNRVNNSIGVLVWRGLKSKKAGRSWQDLLGYSLKELIEHLEKRFDKNMNWDNYGAYWHIDHIKPRSLFKYKTAEDVEFKKCWSLSNLQPLEKRANLIKSNHFNK